MIEPKQIALVTTSKHLKMLNDLKKHLGLSSQSKVLNLLIEEKAKEIK